MGEHLLCKQGVIGSNPFISTKPFSQKMAANGPFSKKTDVSTRRPKAKAKGSD